MRSTVIDMNKLIGTAVAAVVIALTATPAHAAPLHSKGKQNGPMPACARVVVTAKGDCTVRHGFHLRDRRQSRAALIQP
jgi:hypothetical protein